MDFTKTIISLALMASESIAHGAEGRMGYWLRAHSGSRNITQWIAISTFSTTGAWARDPNDIPQDLRFDQNTVRCSGNASSWQWGYYNNATPRPPPPKKMPLEITIPSLWKYRYFEIAQFCLLCLLRGVISLGKFSSSRRGWKVNRDFNHLSLLSKNYKLRPGSDAAPLMCRT